MLSDIWMLFDIFYVSHDHISHTDCWSSTLSTVWNHFIYKWRAQDTFFMLSQYYFIPTRNADQLGLPSVWFLTSIKTLEKMLNKTITYSRSKFQMSDVKVKLDGTQCRFKSYNTCESDSCHPLSPLIYPNLTNFSSILKYGFFAPIFFCSEDWFSLVQILPQNCSATLFCSIPHWRNIWKVRVFWERLLPEMSSFLHSHLGTSLKMYVEIWPQVCPCCSGPEFEPRPWALFCVSLPHPLILFPVTSSANLSVKQ